MCYFYVTSYIVYDKLLNFKKLLLTNTYYAYVCLDYNSVLKISKILQKDQATKIFETVINLTTQQKCCYLSHIVKEREEF